MKVAVFETEEWEHQACLRLELVRALQLPDEGIWRCHHADGHLRAVIEIIEAGKHCLEIAQQSQAVEKTVVNAKRAPIHDHMDHCLDVDHSPADRAELKAIARYL